MHAKKAADRARAGSWRAAQPTRGSSRLDRICMRAERAVENRLIVGV